jgi:hypothetical protein
MGGEPLLCKGTGRHDRESTVSGIRECGANQSVRDALATCSRRNRGMLDVENRIVEIAVHQLGFATRDDADEPLLLGVMTNGHSISCHRIQ